MSMPSWLNVAKSPADAAMAEPAISGSRDREATVSNSAPGDRHRSRRRAAREGGASLQRDCVWTWDYLMVIDKSVAAVGNPVGEGFTSGEIDGRAYLYDYRRKAVTCAGRVHAENSDEVRFKYTRRLGGIRWAARERWRSIMRCQRFEVRELPGHRGGAAFHRAGPP